MSEMFAVVADEPGGPEVLRYDNHFPVPRPEKGQLLVRVACAGINPIDCARRAGYGRRAMKLFGAAKFPLVLGNDFVGVVAGVGSGVSGRKIGEWVFGCKGPSRSGTHAEYAVCPATQILPLPDALSMEQAAVLPYSFVTAWRLITEGLGERPADWQGRHVLVHGGSGAVGSLAVRLLTHWGAIADISGRALDPEWCTQLGARKAFDLSQTQFDDVGRPYDAILNCAQFQGEDRLFPLLRQGGRYATIVHPLISEIDKLGWLRGAVSARSIWRNQADRVRQAGGMGYRWVLFRPDQKAFAAMAILAGKGLLRPQIAVEFPATEASEAHRRMDMGGLQGKLILRMQ